MNYNLAIFIGSSSIQCTRHGGRRADLLASSHFSSDDRNDEDLQCGKAHGVQYVSVLPEKSVS